MLLVLSNLLLILNFLSLKLFCESVDLFFLLVKNFVFLLFAGLSVFLLKILINFFDILLIVVDHLFHIENLFIHLLNFGVVMLNTVLKSFSSFWKWQVHLVGLEFKILLLFEKIGSLFLQVLGSLLESILSQSGFGLCESTVDVFQFVSRVDNLLVEHGVLFLEFFILVSLLRIQIVQSGLILEVDLLNLTLIVLNFGFHVSLFPEKVIQVSSLLVILVLNMHIECLDIFRLGITSILVESKVIISQFSLVFSHILDKGFVLSLEREISGVILVDIFYLLLHLVDLLDNLIVLVFQKIDVVGAIIDLTTRSLILHLDAGHTMIGDRSVDCFNLGVVTDTRKICLSHGGGLTHRSTQWSHACLHSLGTSS